MPTKALVPKKKILEPSQPGTSKSVNPSSVRLALSILKSMRVCGVPSGAPRPLSR